MNIKATFLTLIVSGCILFTLGSCKKDELKGDWLIPKDEVQDGGPGKDGIPALTNPALTDVAGGSYLSDNDLILGFVDGSEVRAYPHPILDWHEIINDDIGSHSFAVIYCPLTGTGIGWNRVVNGVNTTFGVSGLLYNSNLIPYDRGSNSNWSQLMLKCVNGPLIGTNASTYNLLETTWKTWKNMYPTTKVVSTSTGYNRSYGTYPYGDYKINNNKFLFPVSFKDTRLPLKERVLGVIIGDKSKAYSINKFVDTVTVIHDVLNNKNIVVAGNKSKNFIVAYHRLLQDSTMLSFQAVQNALPVIMVDNEGTSWDIMGNGVSGPRAGQKLQSVTQFMGYWFAWGVFYPGIEIY